MVAIIIVISLSLLWYLVIKPWAIELNNKELVKQQALKKPIINSWETKKLNDLESIPTDDEILKYYKMYCKKSELNDEWTTIEPMTYEEFESKCKIPTKDIEIESGWDDMVFRTDGGYQYMIKSTCDLFMENAIIRYIDYAKMVEQDELEK